MQVHVQALVNDYSSCSYKDHCFFTSAICCLIFLRSRYRTMDNTLKLRPLFGQMPLFCRAHIVLRRVRQRKVHKVRFQLLWRWLQKEQ